MPERVAGGGAGWWRALLREPLVHFVLLGAVVFALERWAVPAVRPAAGADIVVSEARLRSLAQNFQRTWQRPPTRVELDGLIDGYVREEVLVREALALGLDRDDTIVRRRLQQKMEFLTEEAAATVAPTDAELEAALAAQSAAYARPARATFAQVYLDPAQRAATLDAEVRRLLAALNGPAPPDPARLGDPLRLLEPRYDDLPEPEIERRLGRAFAASLATLPVGRWAGPVVSGYGVHLVRVESTAKGGVPTLAEVRPLVEREWRNAKRREIAGAYEAKLREKVRIRIEATGAPP